MLPSSPGTDTPLAGHGAEGGGGLLRVLVVPDRSRPADGQHAGAAGTEHVAVVIDDHGVSAEGERGRRRIGSGSRHRRPHPVRLGGAEQVGEQGAGQVAGEADLGLAAPHHASGHEQLQGRQVPALRGGVERLEDRPGEGVTDHGHGRDALSLDGIEQ
jgi:hypothetical protein